MVYGFMLLTVGGGIGYVAHWIKSERSNYKVSQVITPIFELIESGRLSDAEDSIFKVRHTLDRQHPDLVRAGKVITILNRMKNEKRYGKKRK